MTFTLSIIIFTVKTYAYEGGYGTTYQDMYTNYLAKGLEYGRYDRNTYVEHPTIDNRYIFGHVEEYELSEEKVSLVSHEGGAWGMFKDYINKEKYAYCLSYLMTIEYPVETFRTIRCNKDDIIEATYEHTETKSLEFSLTETLGTEISGKIKGKADGFGFEVGANLSTSLQVRSVRSTTISEGTSYKHTTYIKESGLYKIQRRERFNVYALSLYEVVYYPTIIDNSSWYTKDVTYLYNKQTYKYLGTENYFKITEPNIDVVAKYSYDNEKHEYYYDDEKNSGVIYF